MDIYTEFFWLSFIELRNSNLLKSSPLFQNSQILPLSWKISRERDFRILKSGLEILADPNSKLRTFRFCLLIPLKLEFWITENNIVDTEILTVTYGCPEAHVFYLYFSLLGFVEGLKGINILIWFVWAEKEGFIIHFT